MPALNVEPRFTFSPKLLVPEPILETLVKMDEETTFPTRQDLKVEVRLRVDLGNSRQYFTSVLYVARSYRCIRSLLDKYKQCMAILPKPSFRIIVA